LAVLTEVTVFSPSGIDTLGFEDFDDTLILCFGHRDDSSADISLNQTTHALPGRNATATRQTSTTAPDVKQTRLYTEVTVWHYACRLQISGQTQK
jgi:hypothetical protein